MAGKPLEKLVLAGMAAGVLTLGVRLLQLFGAVPALIMQNKERAKKPKKVE